MVEVEWDKCHFGANPRVCLDPRISSANLGSVGHCHSFGPGHPESAQFGTNYYFGFIVHQPSFETVCPVPKLGIRKLIRKV